MPKSVLLIIKNNINIPPLLILIQKRVGGGGRERERDGGLIGFYALYLPTSPKAPRPITFIRSKSERCNEDSLIV